MKKICAHALILFFGFGFTLTVARAHGLQQQDDTLRLKAELVQIDVVVTDKQNRPALGLKKGDFIVLEDGKPQEISFFSLQRAYGTRAPGEEKVAEGGRPASPVADLIPEPGRFIFIILDQYNISPSNHASLRGSLLRFIADDVGPQDQVAIIGTSGSLAVFQQATKNRRALELAINAFLGEGADLRAAMAVDQALNNAQRDLGIPASRGSEAYQEYIIRKTLTALKNIATGVNDVPGRKLAIFVSENLPIQFTNSAGTDDNFLDELNRVISRSRRGGLTFYTVDPRGLVTTIPGGSAAEAVGGSMLGGGSTREDPGARADSLLSSRWGMMELAAATGGYAIFNTNNVRAGLQRVLAENEAYYLLAYYPQNASMDGKFRNIKVRVKDRPDLVVRTRKGYTAVREKDQKPTKSDSKQERIKESLASLAPIRNIKVAIAKATAGSNIQTGERSVKTLIQIDPRSVSFLAGGNNRPGSIEVIGFVYDLKNKLVDGFSQTLKPKPESYQRLLTGGITVPGEIKLKRSGLYNVRVVVIDQESGEIGTASEWVEAR